ncbi:hypothetical protein ACFQ34_13505 [Pseudonocardia benzenivorans]|uniref:Uncharacterized protein n=2 Tax=Pseudonocardia TaxID=1847 RepID=F4CWM4_PSEUX|nr:hypothetical protein [Pseudonocardia dioxanivorans]AEA28716.1 hypothetical protein Psed_6628 [Pseudonocardia dioxanivorans CB1190]GJF01747.1 hypothetical protein PSD17_07110 [Pseudonocardia sp. D17]
MTTAQYLVFLVVAVALTVAVGRVLFLSGEPFLEEVFQSNETARSLNVLLTVLFHLLTLGVLAIISTVDVPVEGVVQTMVTKFGIVLVVVGVAYGVSMLVLLKVRERRRAAITSENVQVRIAEQKARSTTMPTTGGGEPVPPAG